MKRSTKIFPVIVLLVILGGCFGSLEDDYVSLNASVSFDGAQFIIQNNDSFDYKDVRLILNNDYELDNQTIRAGRTYTVGVMQFSDDAGHRFTPMMKPKSFTIFCKLNNEKLGSFFASWN